MVKRKYSERSLFSYGTFTSTLGRGKACQRHSPQPSAPIRCIWHVPRSHRLPPGHTQSTDCSRAHSAHCTSHCKQSRSPSMKYLDFFWVAKKFKSDCVGLRLRVVGRVVLQLVGSVVWVFVDGWVERSAEGWVDLWVGRWVSRWVGEQICRWLGGDICGWLVEWVGGWLFCWMH